MSHPGLTSEVAGAQEAGTTAWTHGLLEEERRRAVRSEAEAPLVRRPQPDAGCKDAPGDRRPGLPLALFGSQLTPRQNRVKPDRAPTANVTKKPLAALRSGAARAANAIESRRTTTAPQQRTLSSGCSLTLMRCKLWPSGKERDAPLLGWQLVVNFPRRQACASSSSDAAATSPCAGSPAATGGR